MAFGTPTRGSLLGTYHGSIRESERVKGLKSQLSPKDSYDSALGLGVY